MMIPVPPWQYRILLVAGYRDGHLSWGYVYRELYNGGWRGPVDKDGFPTNQLGKNPLL